MWTPPVWNRSDRRNVRRCSSGTSVPGPAPKHDTQYTQRETHRYTHSREAEHSACVGWFGVRGIRVLSCGVIHRLSGTTRELPRHSPREGSRVMAHTAATPFGDLLRRHRQANGLTQAELAERAGLSWRGINDLERGVQIG